MLYIVGEQLGTGRSRRKLADLLGVSEPEMMDRAVWVNLWDVPGAVPANYARMVEQAALHDDSIILLGRKVAEQFALGDRPFLTRVDRNAGVGPAMLLLPHPSGLNRWYNDDAAEEKAREALHSLWLRSAL